MVNTMLLEWILVVVTLAIALKWHSATLNINVTLLSTFHNPPQSNISICLYSGEGKFSPEHFPAIKNDKHLLIITAGIGFCRTQPSVKCPKYIPTKDTK